MLIINLDNVNCVSGGEFHETGFAVFPRGAQREGYHVQKTLRLLKLKQLQKCFIKVSKHFVQMFVQCDCKRTTVLACVAQVSVRQRSPPATTSSTSKGDPEAFPSQPRDISACPGSALCVLQVGHMQSTSPRRGLEGVHVRCLNFLG